MIDQIKAEIEKVEKIDKDDWNICVLNTLRMCLKKAEECRDNIAEGVMLKGRRFNVKQAFEGSNKLLKSTNECQISSSNHSSKENK